MRRLTGALAAFALVAGAVSFAGAVSAQQRPAASAQKAKTKPKTPPRRTAPAPKAVAPALPAVAQIAPGDGPLVVRYAALYADYLNEVDAVATPSIRSQSEIDATLSRLARHPGERLAKGWIAYGALVASEEPALIEDARKLASYYGVDVMVRGLRASPAYARSMRGGSQAVERAVRTSDDSAARIATVAQAYKALSYEVQRQPWSQVRLAPAQTRPRIATLRSAALAPRAPNPDTLAAIAPASGASVLLAGDPNRTQRFWTATRWGAAQAQIRPGAGVTSSAGSPADRMTALAALIALEAPDTPPDAAQTLLNSRSANNCFEGVRLNTNQCIAAAGRPYEQVFCIAEHPLGEVAKCLSAVNAP